MIRLVSLFAVILLTAQVTYAQEVLTLEECLEIAVQNNLQVKRAENNYLIAKSNRLQAIGSFLPSVNARVDYDYFVGTTFDQNVERLVTETTNRSNPTLRGNWDIFTGFSKVYNYKNRTLLKDAAENSIEGQKLNTRTSVYNAYLAIVLDRENIKISEERITLLEEQLKREEKRAEVGVSNLETVYNFKSQLASEKLSNVNLKNQLQADYLTLFQLLRLDLGKNYVIAPLLLEEEEDLREINNFNNILTNAVDYSPNLKASTLNMEASLLAFKSARAGIYPTLNMFAMLGSNYSSNGVFDPVAKEVDTDADYFKQVRLNKFEYLQFNINIPIFNNFRVRNNIQVARINISNAEIDREQAYQDITNTVQRTYLDYVTSRETYLAAKENLTALDQSFNFVKRRHEEGLTDFYTYLESLNNKNRAEIELANARYGMIFRKKILELLQGEN